MSNKSYLFSVCLTLLLLCMESYSFAQNWSLVWSDEFNNPGLPDPQKWSYDIGGDGWGNNELQYYTDSRTENARIEDTALIIELRKESYSGRNYTSARLVSKNQGDWLYGRIEVRAKLPSGKGTWPAIWMLSTDWEYGNWPVSGEIDIMEHVGYDPGVVHATVHTDSLNHTKGTQVGVSTLVSDCFTQFHIYAIEWFADHIDGYVDGNKYFTFNNRNAGYKTWPFDKKFHLILNTAFGGNWGGAQGTDSTIITAPFYIDYVRVYQEAQSGPISLAVNSSSGGTVDINPQKTEYTSGDEIVITASADNGYEFDSWSGDLYSYANPLTFNIIRNTNVKAIFSHKGEMVIDGGFDNGLKEWSEWSDPSASAGRAVSDGKFEINITEPGTADWHLQLSQAGMNMIAGHTYRFSFNAWAENSRSITARINMTVAPYSTWFSKTLSISTDSVIYVYDFTMPEPGNSNARVEFDFGISAITTFIDNISLEDITSPTDIKGNRLNHNSINQTISMTPVKQLFIGNQKFDQGYNLLGKQVRFEGSPKKLSHISNGIYIVPANLAK